MKQGVFKILENRPLTPTVHLLRLGGDASAITKAGQFAALKAEGCFLRRPFSVHDFNAEEFSVLYKRVGRGTEKLAELTPGAALEALTGLGNGYDSTCAGGQPLLVGGGTGVSPLLALAKQLLREGKKPAAVLGFASAEEVLGAEELAELAVPVTITTADGSRGVKGFVTDALPERFTYVYSCGPEPMLKALAAALPSGCRGMQVSLEARMGCGFGACMGCTCRTAEGPKRVCREGPVFTKEELQW